MKWFWWLIIGILIIPMMFGRKAVRRKARRVKRIATTYRRRASRLSRKASFVPRSRGRRKSSGKKIRLNGRMLSPKAWGREMQRLRRA